jgi:hypothetical protein
MPAVAMATARLTAAVPDAVPVASAAVPPWRDVASVWALVAAPGFPRSPLVRAVLVARVSAPLAERARGWAPAPLAGWWEPQRAPVAVEGRRAVVARLQPGEAPALEARSER